MKKLKFCIVTLLILLAFTGCSEQRSSETAMSLDEITSAIVKSQSDIPELEQITSEDANFYEYLSKSYLISEEQTEDGMICYAEGAQAYEIAVLVMTDNTAAESAETLLQDYITKRADIFEGYAPEQAELAKGGITVVNGKYVALLICGDTSAAETAFLNCFGENANGSSAAKTVSTSKSSTESAAETEITTEKETEKVSEKNTDPAVSEEDIYDRDAVLQAWRSGDDSSLSEINLSILNAAKDMIDREIGDGMSDYEKELAVHDWITDRASFDYGVFDRSSGGFEENSDNPYGVLIEREAMCHGYSSTFQLFMDMLDIECITVFGTPDSNGIEHSWNMVKLDGEWYCVDVAWDDPIGGTPGHSYFNVTSQYLRDRGIHHWDENEVPEAEGTAYGYGNQ